MRSWTNGRMVLVAAVAIATVACDPQPVPLDGGDASVGRDGGGPPPPYTPPAEGAPECELAADCPAGTYCDLGECIQDCSTADPCTGSMACLPRGRCAMDPTEASDPPVATTPTPSVSVGTDVVHLGESGTLVSVMVSASPTDVDVRYRVDPLVPWITVGEPRGTFRGAVMLELSVDRSMLEVGPHEGGVLIRTTAGDIVFGVHLTQGYTALYEGEVVYETPRELGRLPVRVEVQDRGGSLDVRFLSDESPTFPRAGGRQPTFAAAVAGTMITGSLVQSFTPAELGGPDRLFDRPIGRDFQFTASPTATGGIEGTFSERWVGIFPAAVTVGGRITLSRVRDEPPGDFTVDLPGSLPTNPTSVPPAISAECLTASAPVGTETGTACTAASTPAQLRACGLRLATRSMAVRTANLVAMGSTSGRSEYDDVADICRTNLDATAAPLPGPGGATGCVHVGNLTCARVMLASASSRGDGTSSSGMADTVAARSEVGLLVVNDHLVEAFELPYRSPGAGVESLVIGAFDEARTRARDGLRDTLSAPWALEILRTLPPTTASATDYAGLRRLAQLVVRERNAAGERESIIIRTRPAELSAVRADIHEEALEALLTLVTLSSVEAGQDAPPTPELGLFASTLSTLGRRSLEASGRIDALGLPIGFVPFLFTPGSGGATNFEQVLSGYRGAIDEAVADEAAARSSTRAFETNVAMLQAQLMSIESQTRAQLVALCGSGVGAEPAEDCGASTGEIALARSSYEEAVAGVASARARVDSLEARIAIERARVANVAGVRAETLEFIDNANATINALSHVALVFRAIREALEVSSNANLLNGFSSIGMGVVVGVMSAIESEIAIQQDMLRQSQELRVRADESRVEVINGMAGLAEMMTQASELGLMVTEALLRAATAALHARTLEARAESVRAERALLIEQLDSSFANDPSVRALRNVAVAAAISSHDEALYGAYLAGRALEHELNWEMTDIESALVPALTASDVQSFYNCLPTARTRFRTAFGAVQSYTDEVSLREDVFGIRGPILDEYTGEMLSEAEQFHRVLLAAGNRRREGIVLTFATTLARGNGVFRTTSCNDQITSIAVRLVGDGLGDAEADVTLAARGVETMRGCESPRSGMSDVVRTWDVQPGVADIAAGVNVYPASPPSTIFNGRSVANSAWELGIPIGDTHPDNADIDVARVDDIVIRLEHTATSLSDSTIAFDPMCGD